MPDGSRTSGHVIHVSFEWTWQCLGLVRVNHRRQRAAERLATKMNVVTKAMRYEAALDGGRLTQASVAEKYGVTEEEVCQYVALVRRLPPQIVDALAREQDPRRLRQLGLRPLLRIARSRWSEATKMDAVKSLVGG